MFTLTLEPNRSTPLRRVTTITFERTGDKVTPIRRVFDGPGHCISTQVVPWPRKDWSATLNGEIGTHKRPFTIKRDWIQLHTALAMHREGV